jgi:hypothetical protein
MKKTIFLLFAIFTVLTFNNCKEELVDTQNLNYVTFEVPSFDFGVDLNSSNTREIKIYSTQVSGSDRTYNLRVIEDATSADPNSYEVPATVTIPANSNEGVFSVTVSDVNIGEEGETLVLDFEAKDGLFKGENIVLNIRQVCPFNEVLLKITFDSWPEETSWELLDSDDVVINSGGPYPDQTSYNKAFCLQDGEYTFIIYDAYGDGINPPGGYTLTYNGEILASGDAFGDSESTTFIVSMN